MADLIRTRVADEWPAQVVALAGAWSDLTTAEELRFGQREDVPCEPIWADVDRYVFELLLQLDPALENALTASAAAGLLQINVSLP